jgi:hypothetical protein
MAEGSYQGHGLESSEVRDLFKKENILKSDWYKQRLLNKQAIEVKLLEKKIANVEEFMANPHNSKIIVEEGFEAKLVEARKELDYHKSDDYLNTLVGSIGAEAIAAK